MVLLEISQNSQENTCTRASFLIKFQALNTFFHRTPPVAAPVKQQKIINDWKTFTISAKSRILDFW